MNVHFSSETDLWATPQDTFDALNAEFGPFDVDVCAVAGTPKVWERQAFGTVSECGGGVSCEQRNMTKIEE